MIFESDTCLPGYFVQFVREEEYDVAEESRRLNLLDYKNPLEDIKAFCQSGTIGT